MIRVDDGCVDLRGTKEDLVVDLGMAIYALLKKAVIDTTDIAMITALALNKTEEEKA